MPINGILDLQRRDIQLGEIRIGTSVPVPGKSGRKPVRLETFRFTTASEHTARVVAAKYGGKVAPWSQRKGRWEVITDHAALDVWVPPSVLAVDANMEMWDGPRRLRHCDGIREALSGRPCMCPRAEDPSDPESVQRARDERKRLAGLRPPQACKPLTRINVTIPNLPGLVGVWRLNTGSENTAVEAPAAGEAMQLAREGGVYLPAVLRLEWRWRAADGSPYPVPVLHIGLSMEEVAQAALPAGTRGLVAQIRSSQAFPAITSGTPGHPEKKAIEGRVVEPPPDLSMVDDRERLSAQQMAALAAGATSRHQLLELIDRAEAAGVADDKVHPDPEGAPDWEPTLREWLRLVWRNGVDGAMENTSEGSDR